MVICFSDFCLQAEKIAFSNDERFLCGTVTSKDLIQMKDNRPPTPTLKMSYFHKRSLRKLRKEEEYKLYSNKSNQTSNNYLYREATSVVKIVISVDSVK